MHFSTQPADSGHCSLFEESEDGSFRSLNLRARLTAVCIPKAREDFEFTLAVIVFEHLGGLTILMNPTNG
jgi:hypothetical protein